MDMRTREVTENIPEAPSDVTVLNRLREEALRRAIPVAQSGSQPMGRPARDTERVRYSHD